MLLLFCIIMIIHLFFRPYTQYFFYIHSLFSQMFRVDGGFTAFSTFSTCTKSCGGGGTQRRSRSCSNPKPLFGGKDCVGPREETKVCGEIPCPGNNKQLRKYLSFFLLVQNAFKRILKSN